MAGKQHTYSVTVSWDGDTLPADGPRGSHSRNHSVRVDGKDAIAGSSDPGFRGDASRWNPEELLVVSLSQCHMLWYLGLAAKHGIGVTSYVDQATGTMAEDSDGAGRFTGVTLNPVITLAADADRTLADSLHHDAHEKCFIANSVNFPVTAQPTYEPAE